MKYKYCCVVDSNGYYKEFVVVYLDEDNTGMVYHYEMQEGESLVECSLAPAKKVHAESDGFIKPKWNGGEWVEGATEEEIAEWNEQHPAPVPNEDPEFSVEERLSDIEAQLLATDEVAVELYEQQLAQEEINIAQDEAIVALYEMMEV